MDSLISQLLLMLFEVYTLHSLLLQVICQWIAQSSISKYVFFFVSYITRFMYEYFYQRDQGIVLNYFDIDEYIGNIHLYLDAL